MGMGMGMGMILKSGSWANGANHGRMGQITIALEH